jgi:hypothetical protein
MNRGAIPGRAPNAPVIEHKERPVSPCVNCEKRKESYMDEFARYGGYASVACMKCEHLDRPKDLMPGYEDTHSMPRR